MLTSVNIHSSVAVYEQIENEVQFAIASGKLKPGDQLPAAQKLGKTVGVNFNTVAKAYRDLEVMGLLYARRGMGVFVKKGAQAICRVRVRAKVIEKLHEVTQEARASGMSKANLNAVIGTSFGLDTSPYGDLPAEIKALLKAKK